jgi:mannose-6-phosphate isomerase-like protein (cupin superfamily)
LAIKKRKEDMMATLIERPTTIQAAGTPPKQIEEFIGRVNSGTDAVSIARMRSPSGWEEPGQTPKFDEYTVVLKGVLHIRCRDGEFEVHEGQAFIAQAGEWVRYSTPEPEGAEYIAICVPAFSPGNVRRDEP